MILSREKKAMRYKYSADFWHSAAQSHFFTALGKLMVKFFLQPHSVQIPLNHLQFPNAICLNHLDSR